MKHFDDRTATSNEAQNLQVARPAIALGLDRVDLLLFGDFDIGESLSLADLDLGQFVRFVDLDLGGERDVFTLGRLLYNR